MLTEIQESYKDWIVYEIYPRSFKDSNGDGIGDIQGIIQKLDYLEELGVNAVWLSPCYKSPNEDNGYDIADYYDIMDEFGTLDDWKEMIAGMHQRGIKLIMDFVANHTSSEHKWFKESRKSKDNPYRDYYYWVDEPINDWQSTFRGSAWEYDETTKQYYLHSYAVGQPDLNWENPKVREEMVKIIDFWVDLGVDGFRCDVLDQISKDFENDLDRCGPRLHEYIKMLFGRAKTEHIFTVGECWGATEENMSELIGGDRKELSTSFQFDHITVGAGYKFAPTEYTLDELRDVLVHWQELMQREELLYTLFWENHDTMRVLSHYGNETEFRYESATMLAAMYFLQNGMPFIYQGQEIGVTNSYYTDMKDFDDIETHNFYNMNPLDYTEEEKIRCINFGSRDNARRPMPWDASKNGGFSTADKTWISLYNRYEEVNVKNDRASEKSIFNFYKGLIEIRKKYNAVRHGVYKNVTDGRKGIYVYQMSDKDTSILVVCNFEKESQLDIELSGRCLLSNYGRENDLSGTYKPYECAVFLLC